MAGTAENKAGLILIKKKKITIKKIIKKNFEIFIKYFCGKLLNLINNSNKNMMIKEINIICTSILK